MNYITPLVNSNLDPHFWEYDLPPEPEPRRLADYETQRNLLTKKDEKYRDSEMFQKSSGTTNYISTLEGIQEKNEMNTAFFSIMNIDFVQKCIRYNVYLKSNKEYIIQKQSETELVLIMRAVYLEYSKYTPDHAAIQTEIARIDQIVVNKITPRLISEITQYKGYLKDASTIRQPLDMPQSTSITGTKVLRAVTDVLNPNRDIYN